MSKKSLKFLNCLGKPFKEEETTETVLGFKFKHVTVIISTISEVLTKYQRLHNFGHWNKDLNIKIIVPELLEKKVSPEDAESLVEIVYKIVEQFHTPSFNINYMFYSDTSFEFNNIKQYGVVHMRNVWSFKDLWKGDGDYITIVKNRNNTHHQEKFDIDFSFLEKQAEKLNIKVKYLYYGMSFDEMKKTLLHTKMFFVPTGGFITLAVCMKVPFCKVNKPFIEALKYQNGVSTFISGNEILGMTNCTNFIDDGKIQQKCFKDNFIAISTNGNNENILEDILSTNDLRKLYMKYVDENEKWVAGKINHEMPFDLNAVYE